MTPKWKAHSTSFLRGIWHSCEQVAVLTEPAPGASLSMLCGVAKCLLSGKGQGEPASVSFLLGSWIGSHRSAGTAPYPQRLVFVVLWVPVSRLLWNLSSPSFHFSLAVSSHDAFLDVGLATSSQQNEGSVMPIPAKSTKCPSSPSWLKRKQPLLSSS